ncbi:hypothetical protein SMNI109538_20900 [Smaragdicoccus niigatensis]
MPSLEGTSPVAAVLSPVMSESEPSHHWRYPRGSTPRKRTAPTIVRSPRTTNVAFMSRCNGEQRIALHAVTPRSLIESRLKL